MAVLLSAGAQAAEAQSIGDLFGRTVGTIKDQFNKPAPAASTPAPAAVEARPAAGGASGAVASTHDELFRKHVVSGEDLYGTLKSMRAALRAKRSAAAWARLNASVEKNVNPQSLMSGNVDIVEILKSTTVSFALESMKGTVNDIASKTLDDYLDYLLDKRRDALAAETIELPNPGSMTPAQKERTITLATLIVAARVSNKVLQKAEEDFKSLQVDYKSLLDQREKAARLLFTTIDQRRAARDSKNEQARGAAEADMRSLSTKDVAFIDDSLSQMSLKDFSKDMAAQNLAVQYLQTKDRAAFDDYRVKADDVVRRTTGVVRTVSGVAAFGGLVMTFGHEMGSVARESTFNSAILAAPLGFEFVKAAAPLAAKSIEVSMSGVTVAAADSVFDRFRPRPDAFSVIRAGKTNGVRSSSDAFKAVQDANLSDDFVAALFSSDNAGWLNHIRLCDPEETGRMIDAAVPQEARSKFATDYFGWTDSDRAADFSFIGNLTQPGDTPRERRLADELLGRDQRKRADSLPVAEVQRIVEAKYGVWSNEQLLRIIFHNRESGAAYATLDIGELSIRPVPSPDAVYAYESRVESCRRITDADASAPAPVTGKAPTRRASTAGTGAAAR